MSAVSANSSSAAIAPRSTCKRELDSSDSDSEQGPPAKRLVGARPADPVGGDGQIQQRREGQPEDSNAASDTEGSEDSEDSDDSDDDSDDSDDGYDDYYQAFEDSNDLSVVDEHTSDDDELHVEIIVEMPPFDAVGSGDNSSNDEIDPSRAQADADAEDPHSSDMDQVTQAPGLGVHGITLSFPSPPQKWKISSSSALTSKSTANTSKPGAPRMQVPRKLKARNISRARRGTGARMYIRAYKRQVL